MSHYLLPASVVITKNGVVLRASAFQLLHAYTRYFIQHSRAKLDEYLFDLGGSLTDPVATAAQAELCKAVELIRLLDEVDNHMIRIYDRNFEIWAQVFRQTRIQLGIAQIEAVPALHLAVIHMMAMLKAENPTFSAQKFIDSIHEGATV